MKCQKCGTANSADSDFCSNCGAKLGKEEDNSSKQEIPAKQAEKIVKKFQFVLKKLSLGEKLISAGAILALISFLMPWVVLQKSLAKNLDLSETMTGVSFGGWLYLLPISMLVILALLYFSVGASAKVKIKYSSYCLVIGAVFATVCVVFFNMFSRVEKWFFELMKGYGTAEDIFSFGIGCWFLILGSLAIIVGSFLVQKENLKE